jgi:hypothetical protein
MKTGNQPRRFAVLRHEGHGEPHFDLLIAACAVYLDYEGPVWTLFQESGAMHHAQLTS